MDSNISFGYWLQRRRKALDLTQAQLARHVGCALGTIRKLETDERRPSRAMAVRLAQVLEVPVVEQDVLLQTARADRSINHLALPTQPLCQRRAINLPIAATSLIGRSEEVAALWEALSGTNVRLLTLVGPPGIGKTRLSLQVAAELADHFADGVCFVTLASITDPEMVAPMIAQALEVKETAGQSWRERLTQMLHDQALLLVLDNFEQVVDAAPLVGELLATAPRLKMLVTSRVPLHIYGEHEFAVRPLALPDLAQLPSVEGLVHYEALRLFTVRAQAVKANFELSADNAAAVAQICAHLDGLPLAIELAAARIKFFSPHMLLGRLQANNQAALHLLRRGARDVPPRHQTLRCAIAWSYNLLNATEQRLFRQLGVFQGGWTVDAAAVVCSAGAASPLDTEAELEALLDHSLVVQLAAVWDKPRFGLLETLREYALEQLAGSGEVAQAQQRHASYYLAFAERAAAQLHGQDQAQWLDKLEAEHNNFRAALTWSMDHGAADTALRLAVALMRFWLAHAHLSEGRQWLERAIAMSNGLPLALRAKALFEAGGLADQQGDHDRQRVLQEASLALYQQLGDRLGMAAVLNCLANAESDPVRSRALTEESLQLYREQGDTAGIAKVLINLGSHVGSQGDYKHGQMLLEESLALFKQLGDINGIAYALINVGCLVLAQNHYAEALALFKESLVLFQQLGDRRLIAFCIEGLADAMAHDQAAQAARLWGAAERLQQVIGVALSPEERSLHQRFLCSAQDTIGGAAFANAWAEGRAMTFEQAVACALDGSSFLHN